MIANVLSMNEMTKYYRVIFDSGYENYFRVHIGDIFAKFTGNGGGIYLSKLDMKFFRKMAEEKN